MKPEIKELWVKALRSGEYVQGNQFLIIPDDKGQPVKACCLGVLCDLAVQQGLSIKSKIFPGKYVEFFSPERPLLDHENKEHNFNLQGDRLFLPPAVAEWAGVDDCDPLVYVHDIEREGHVPLTELNDQGMSFDELADLIEEQL